MSVVAHAEGPVVFDTPRIVYSEEDECMLDVYMCKMGVQGFPYFLYLDTDENLFLDIYSVSTCWHSVSSHPLSLIPFFASLFHVSACVGVVC